MRRSWSWSEERERHFFIARRRRLRPETTVLVFLPPRRLPTKSHNSFRVEPTHEQASLGGRRNLGLGLKLDLDQLHTLAHLILHRTFPSAPKRVRWMEGKPTLCLRKNSRLLCKPQLAA